MTRKLERSVEEDELHPGVKLRDQPTKISEAMAGRRTDNQGIPYYHIGLTRFERHFEGESKFLLLEFNAGIGELHSRQDPIGEHHNLFTVQDRQRWRDRYFE